MGQVHAADLPEGSIVATGNLVDGYGNPRSAVGVRNPDSLPAPWAATTGETWGHPYVDYLLANGATVLRRGYGEEES